MHCTEIKALIELQARDKDIADMTARLAAIPADIERITAAFEEKKGTMNTARETMLALQVEKKNKEILILERDEEIRKHQRELNAIKDNKAYKALLSEIETARKAKDEIETEILELMDSVDTAVAEDKKLQQEVKKLEEEKNRTVAELGAAKTDLAAGIEAAKAGRAEFSAKIAPEIMEKYEFIREQRQGLAIVEVKEDKSGKISCGGCNISLIPQKAVDLKRPDILVFCDNCQRVIYLKKTVYG
ncbi:MAG: hypothetical protein A3J79_05085 [Elusimicrobia bacterium RIFOXYB2_FULL_62_6]|nr:MAG: hypothetical protein A3J79_05085 [Elusimicrobia bacterium RIFOXYB2_FULL_62_6]